MFKLIQKNFLVSLQLFLFILLPQTLCAAQENKFYNQAANDSLRPIRPGVSGKSPFWNKHARNFIYAPAFDFNQLPNAAFYRFTAQPFVPGPNYPDKYEFNPKGDNSVLLPCSKPLVFEANIPWSPLNTIWKELPVGFVCLKVEGLKEKGGDVIGLVGLRWFYRAACFNGPYHKPAMDYRQSAQLALKNLYEEKFVQSWLTTGQPDCEGYKLYHYPAKIMGALVVGSAAYYNLSPQPEDAKEVLEIGKKVADYLLGITFPASSPLEYFPPTYYGIKNNYHMDDSRSMIIYGTDAGHGYLDLYNITKDDKYITAAKRIADTYVKNQLPNGTWYLLVENSTGKPVAKNLCIPTAIINYFDRLVDQYGLTKYKEPSRRAVQWIINNPIKTFNWQAQFEDSGPSLPYNNLAREQACDFAVYLLNQFPKDKSKIDLAKELIRFAEDQFVVWEKPVPTGRSENMRSEFWITPCVQEQYTFWMPVIRSAAIMMNTYMKAYEVTGDEIYKAKALSIANSITISQQTHDGRYETYLTTKTINFWINNVVWPATEMIKLDKALHGVR
jgi:hypothetical protein